VGLDGTDAYTYDYRNRRIKKVIVSTTTSYAWDGDHVLAESGSQSVDYVYAGAKLIGEGRGNVLGGNGSFTFLLGDRLSTRLSLDKNANVFGRQAHLPFGEEFAESGTQEKHHFTSYEADSEAGSDYADNRQYQSGLGRFLRVDPMRGSPTNPQSLNRYGYSTNDPINLKDPLGLECKTVEDWCEDGEHLCEYTQCTFEPPGIGNPTHGGGGGGADCGLLESDLRAAVGRLWTGTSRALKQFTNDVMILGSAEFVAAVLSDLASLGSMAQQVINPPLPGMAKPSPNSFMTLGIQTAINLADVLDALPQDRVPAYFDSDPFAGANDAYKNASILWNEVNTACSSDRELLNKMSREMTNWYNTYDYFFFGYSYEWQQIHSK